MSQADDREVIGRAIQRLFDAAGLPWPPPARRTVTAVPLDTLIRTNPKLEHIEMSELSPVSAGAFLASAGSHWPELLKDKTALDGLLVANASGGFIFVRSDASNPISRRRFTAAHELGHYLLHFLPILESREYADASFVQADKEETVQEADESGTGKVQSQPEMERQANLFAAELLMPEMVCRLAFEQHNRASPRFLEHHLACNLLVSETAIRWRLRNLGLTN
jgi:Zn-dependent peptidase ImmA (M78 family)